MQRLGKARRRVEGAGAARSGKRADGPAHRGPRRAPPEGRGRCAAGRTGERAWRGGPGEVRRGRARRQSAHCLEQVTGRGVPSQLCEAGAPCKSCAETPRRTAGPGGRWRGQVRRRGTGLPGPLRCRPASGSRGLRVGRESAPGFRREAPSPPASRRWMWSNCSACVGFVVVVVSFNFYYNCRGHGGYSQSPRRRPLPGGPKEGGSLGPPDSCHHRGPEGRGSLCGAGWALGRRRPPPCAGSRGRCVGPAAPSPVLGARCDDRRWRALGQEGSYFL